MIGQRIADAALALVGTRFRLHGRDPSSGIDCVGLVELSLRGAGLRASLPNGYALRAIADLPLCAIADASGLSRCGDAARAGDVVAVRPAPCQIHLLIALGERGFVHAHAGLRRVVVLQGRALWPVLDTFRVAHSHEEPSWRP